MENEASFVYKTPDASVNIVRPQMARNQKLNLIEELTTHKCDFQIWPIQPVQAKSNLRSRDPPPVRPPPPSVILDPQSHAPYKQSVHVPFDLYLKPKPIVGTDPRECFTEKKLPKTRIKGESVQFATILSPTLSLNQVEDEEGLNTIIKHTYTGMHKILMEEAALRSSERPRPSNRVVEEGNDLRYRPNLYPTLPPGWIAAARHWDCLQSRNLGDPFKTFWTRKGPEVECSCCCNPLPNMLPKETKEEIDRVICENKINLAYDITKTGYGGYRTIVAKGVPLEKK